MPSDTHTPPNPSAPQSSVELEVFNLLVEAALAATGPKMRLRFLRCLAAVLTETSESNIVDIRVGRPGSDEALARAWLRERLSVWLAQHG